MTWWKKLLTDRTDGVSVDYYREGVDLLRLGHYHEALTSFRLALRDTPGDCTTLQQMAIAYTRIGMTEEATRTYRLVLEKDSSEVSAHYGLAFLMLREGRTAEAVEHLARFLGAAPTEPEAARHIEHARRTLAELKGEASGQPTEQTAPD